MSAPGGGQLDDVSWFLAAQELAPGGVRALFAPPVEAEPYLHLGDVLADLAATGFYSIDDEEEL